MEFGVVLPQIGASWEEALRFAQTAEEGGFDSIWVIDHVLGFPASAGILEAWTVMSALATATERVGIGAQVLCQSFRNPALLAKMATTLDLVSGGRLRFLIGAGWFQMEYDAFHYEFPSTGVRLRQLEDTVRICKGMWSAGTEPFSYQGRHYSVTDLVNAPPPARPIPLGIGGAGDQMLDLVAREADEWNAPAPVLGRYDDRAKILDERLAEHGRQVRRTLQIVFNPGDGDAGGILPMFQPHLGVKGSPDEMAQRVGELAAMGIDGLYGIVPGPDALEKMAEALPGLRAAAG